jgi:hypothetical protein
VSVDVAALARVAIKNANDHARWQADLRKGLDAAKDEPVPGIKKKTWQPPATWGPVVERIVHTVKGLLVERLRFSNGAAVDRLIIPAVGFDT